MSLHAALTADNAITYLIYAHHLILSFTNWYLQCWKALKFHCQTQRS